MGASLPPELEGRSRMRQLLAGGNRPVVTFALNEPRGLPDDPALAPCFLEGVAELHRFALPFHEEWISLKERRWMASLEATVALGRVKRLLMHVEGRHPLGRLFDMDLFDGEGQPVDGVAYHRPVRACYLCEAPALVCRREGRHDPAQLQAFFLGRCRAWNARRLEAEALGPVLFDCALGAMTLEAWAAPKPGLVDRRSPGAHRDMDLPLLLKSAATLAPAFPRFAAIAARRALRGLDAPRALLRRLRPLGRAAEGRMFAATRGVNSHKGLLFSMGILAAATGTLVGRGEVPSPEAICEEGRRMAEGLVEEELGGIQKEEEKEEEKELRIGGPMRRTAGQKNWLLHGSPGIRGEAAQGFPHLLHVALPLLKGLPPAGADEKDAVRILLALMAVLDDSNVLHRGGPEEAQRVRELARAARDAGWPRRADGGKAFEELECYCRRKRLSPGGSADLLACALFLHDLTRKLEGRAARREGA